MAEKQITNPGQAFALGATWGTPSVDNAMTTQTVNLINGTSQILYTGDIVALDATGTQAVLPTTATLNCTIGTVGSPAEMSQYPAQEQIAGAVVTQTFPVIVGSTGGTGISFGTSDGNTQPFSDYAFASVLVGFTNGSGAITSAVTQTSNPFVVGQYIYTPYNVTTNATPQVFVITVAGGSSGSWTGTAVGIAGSATTTFTGTTGSFTCQVGRDYTTKAAGWPNPPGWTNTSAFVPGQVVPIITQGFGRVNINGLSSIIAGDFVIATNGAVVGARVAIGGLTAAQTGYVIAIPLEAYAQRDTTINDIFNISGHNSVRAIIGKM